MLECSIVAARVRVGVLSMVLTLCLYLLQPCRPLGALGSRCSSQRTAELEGNGSSTTVSA